MFSTRLFLVGLFALSLGLGQLASAEEVVFVDGVRQSLEEADASVSGKCPLAHGAAAAGDAETARDQLSVLEKCPHLNEKFAESRNLCPYAHLVETDFHSCPYLQKKGCPFTQFDLADHASGAPCPFAEGFEDVLEQCPHLKQKFSEAGGCPFGQLSHNDWHSCPYLKHKADVVAAEDKEDKKKKDKKDKKKEDKKKKDKKKEDKKKEDKKKEDKKKEDKKKEDKKDKKDEKKHRKQNRDN